MNYNNFKIQNTYYVMCNNDGCYKYVLENKLEKFKNKFNLIGFTYNKSNRKIYCCKCQQQINKKGRGL